MWIAEPSFSVFQSLQIMKWEQQGWKIGGRDVDALNNMMLADETYQINEWMNISVYLHGSGPVMPECETLNASARTNRWQIVKNEKYDFNDKQRNYPKILHCNGEIMEHRWLVKAL